MAPQPLNNNDICHFQCQQAGIVYDFMCREACDPSRCAQAGLCALRALRLMNGILSHPYRQVVYVHIHGASQPQLENVSSATRKRVRLQARGWDHHQRVAMHACAPSLANLSDSPPPLTCPIKDLIRKPLAIAQDIRLVLGCNSWIAISAAYFRACAARNRTSLRINHDGNKFNKTCGRDTYMKYIPGVCIYLCCRTLFAFLAPHPHQFAPYRPPRGRMHRSAQLRAWPN